jgi:NitT/TauT family transport system substrate-binding protein
MIRRRSLAAAAVTTALTVVMLTGSTTSGRAATPPRVTLNIGVLKIAALASVEAAQKLGYFDKEGLDVNLTTANNGNDLMTAMQSGKLDIILAIPGVAMRADEKGYDATLVFQNELAHDKSPDTGALIVKNDSSITSVKQLGGKKIAHSGIGTQAWAAVVDVEMKNGVDPHTVQDLEVSYPQMPGVLAQGLVDAVAAVDPFTSSILAAKQGRVISWFYIDSVPGQPVGTFWASRAWVAKNGDIVKRYQTAMHAAITYMNAHPDDAKRFISDYTGMNADAVRNMTPIRWDDRVSMPAWEQTAKMLVATHVLDKLPTLSDLIPANSVDPGKSAPRL